MISSTATSSLDSRVARPIADTVDPKVVATAWTVAFTWGAVRD